MESLKEFLKVYLNVIPKWIFVEEVLGESSTGLLVEFSDEFLEQFLKKKTVRNF